MTIRDPYRTSFPIFFPPFKDAQALVTAPSRTCYRSQGAYIPEDYYQFLSGAKASSHAGNISLPGTPVIQNPLADHERLEAMVGSELSMGVHS